MRLVRMLAGPALAVLAASLLAPGVAPALGAQISRPGGRPGGRPPLVTPRTTTADSAARTLAAETRLVQPFNCPLAIAAWWREHGRGGRIACAADPTRPAVLLVHGLHQDMRSWTAPSYSDYAYDLRDDPSRRRVGDTHQEPGIGIYKVGASPWLYGEDREGWDDRTNWFEFLRAQGFTVATWGQPGLRFEEAVPSALAAFDSLLAHTAARSPGAPPRVALIGHSRGGLLIRRILKERATTGRVAWVVTLHSPHRGSELARTPGRVVAEAVDLIQCCAPASLTAALRSTLKDAVTEAMRPVTKVVWLDENRELVPDGPLLRGLASGERALPDVGYYTFGGTDPTIFKLYAWTFDAESSLPQYICENGSCRQYFVWRVTPQELGPVSPILDDIRDFVPEVKEGVGDGLVTDASARLPWSTHETTRLNHAAVLWDRPLQLKVARLIGGAPTLTDRKTRAPLAGRRPE